MDFHVKNTTAGWIMDLICPYKCRGCGKIGEALCGCCKKYIIRENAGIFVEFGTQGGEGELFVGGLKDGILEKMITEYKYDSVRGLAAPLAEVVAAKIPDLGKKVVVVPLPTITKHIRARGFDHMVLMGRKLAEARGWEMREFLVRVNATTQVGADSDKRWSQARSAYRVREDFKEFCRMNPEVTYLVLDDVYTTGASITAAAEVLRAAGAQKIVKAVIAKSGT